MAQVLHTHWTEMGNRYLDQVRQEGLEVHQHGETMDLTGGFSSRHATLHTYRSPRLDRDVWVVEIEGYDPSAAHWWTSTVLDARPSLAAITMLADDAARGAIAVGASVEGVN